jgi:concanavalin A-like lectin/glucanase superfamily protein
MLRRIIPIIALAHACSVDKKQPLADGGVDGGGDGPTSGLETTITASPAEFSREGAATFQFTASDPHATFSCSIDGETPVTCATPYTRVLSDGTHSFSVHAVLGAASDDTPAEVVWTIDTVAPQTTITQGPPAADNSVTVQFAFMASEANCTFECSLDNSSYSPCTSGDSFGPLADGPHSFAVRARDRAGNVDAGPAVRAWTIDTRTPDTEIITGPMGATQSPSAQFTFISPDAGAGAVFECALDGAGFTTCTSPFTASALPDGMHVFAVRVRDAVGNVDPTPATRSWSVDRVPPDTTITSGPTGTTPSMSAGFTFTATEPATFECSLDAAPFAACTSPYEAQNLAQGPHSFAVRGTDAAGNVDASPATRAWTVDTTNPELTFSDGPADGTTSGPRVAFVFTTNEGTTTCSLDANAFAACASPVAFNARAGGHAFRVRAVDGAGNATTAQRSWTIACTGADPAGGAGVLHLDDAGQTMTNAVAGGAAATLGDSAMVEVADPASIAGRFGPGLAFTATDGDHVAWPLALAASGALTFEVWSRPDAAAGPRDIAVTGDGKFGLRVAAAGANVTFAVTVDNGGNKTAVASSAGVAAGAWHHVLASLAPPALHLWVDGVRTDAPANPNMPPALDAIRIGGNYSGALDEVWVAQAPITTDEAALARYCPI